MDDQSKTASGWREEIEERPLYSCALSHLLGRPLCFIDEVWIPQLTRLLKQL